MLVQRLSPFFIWILSPFVLFPLKYCTFLMTVRSLPQVFIVLRAQKRLSHVPPTPSEAPQEVQADRTAHRVRPGIGANLVRDDF